MGRRRWGSMLVVAVGIVAVGLATATGMGAALVGDATPCAQASPVAATAVAGCTVVGPQVELGTPAAVAGLTVSLAVSSDQAGPVTLTVRVTDANGAPVSDATVLVKLRHLDMDMGEFRHEALPTAPGVYAADQVGMGMGGHWRVEVDVTRPGQAPVAVFFRVTMQGLA